MKIRTQFILSMAVFGAVLLAISASVIATNQEVERLNGQLDIALRIERDASELSYLWNDYLLYKESQLRARWESKFAAFSADVASLALDARERRVLVDDIKGNQQRLKAVFADVASTLEGTSRVRDGAIAQAFIEDSWSRMAVQNQGIFFNASRLSQMLREQVDQLKQTNILLIFALLLMLGAYFLTNYLIVYRRALQSIAELEAATEIIGSGNLDFAVEEKRNDEIGALLRAFNRMAASLKGVTASKSELEREIVERQRAEAERERLLIAEREARTLAEAAVRMRDEFISIAAHELKTPVTSLLGFAQVVLRELGKTGGVDPARLSRSMERIEQQSKRLAKLTDQLLNLSRLQSGKLTLSPEPADLSPLVRGVVASMRHANPGRTMACRDEGPAPAEIDPLRVEQVLTNLLDNAIKFSPADTPIEVAVEASDPEWVKVTVRDYGIGIPEEKRERIFERYYQAHAERHFGGMGIGLSISRQIAELHGGTIGVESPEDGGSRFIVRLPRRDPVRRPDGEALRHGSPDPGCANAQPLMAGNLPKPAS